VARDAGAGRSRAPSTARGGSPPALRSPAGGPAERPLLRHSRAARQSLRRRAALASYVQMPMPRTGVRANLHDLHRLHREATRRSLELELLLLAPAALPGDEDSSVDQERRSELGERGQAS